MAQENKKNNRAAMESDRSKAVADRNSSGGRTARRGRKSGSTSNRRGRNGR